MSTNEATVERLGQVFGRPAPEPERRERCQMLLRTGLSCGNPARPGKLLCHVHARRFGVDV